jgi:hypothetical protein
MDRADEEIFEDTKAMNKALRELIAGLGTCSFYSKIVLSIKRCIFPTFNNHDKIS